MIFNSNNNKDNNIIENFINENNSNSNNSNKINSNNNSYSSIISPYPSPSKSLSASKSIFGFMKLPLLPNLLFSHTSLSPPVITS